MDGKPTWRPQCLQTPTSPAGPCQEGHFSHSYCSWVMFHFHQIPRGTELESQTSMKPIPGEDKGSCSSFTHPLELASQNKTARAGFREHMEFVTFLAPLHVPPPAAPPLSPGLLLSPPHLSLCHCYPTLNSGAPCLNCLPSWSPRTTLTPLNARLLTLSLFKLGVAASDHGCRPCLFPAAPSTSLHLAVLPPALSFAHAVPCARMSTPSLHEVTVPAPQVSAMEPLRPPHGTIFPS